MTRRAFWDGRELPSLDFGGHDLHARRKFRQLDMRRRVRRQRAPLKTG
jgi:hypothetical protein